MKEVNQVYSTYSHLQRKTYTQITVVEPPYYVVTAYNLTKSIKLKTSAHLVTVSLQEAKMLLFLRYLITEQTMVR